jgi:hypothetical protein
VTRRLAKPRPVQGEAGSVDAARRGTGYAARAVRQLPAQRDGHPRQDPAYRPATERAPATGLSLCLPIRRRLVMLTPGPARRRSPWNRSARSPCVATRATPGHDVRPVDAPHELLEAVGQVGELGEKSIRILRWLLFLAPVRSPSSTHGAARCGSGCRHASTLPRASSAFPPLRRPLDHPVRLSLREQGHEPGPLHGPRELGLVLPARAASTLPFALLVQLAATAPDGAVPVERRTECRDVLVIDLAHALLTVRAATHASASVVM